MVFEGGLGDVKLASWLANLAVQSLVVSAAGYALLRAAKRAPAPLRSAIALTVLMILLFIPAVNILLNKSRKSLFEYAVPFSGESRSGLSSTGPGSGFDLGGPPSSGSFGPQALDGGSEVPSLRPRLPTAGVLIVSIINGLGLLWACGIVILLGGVGRGFALLHSLRKGSVEMPDEAAEGLWRAVQFLFPDGKRPAIYVSPVVPCPVALGVFRPAVILPQAAALSGTDLRSALIHEASHLFHHDHLLGIVQRVVSSIHWWNPLVRGLNRGFSLAREHICDSYAIMGIGPHPFAASLLALAKRTRGFPPYPTVVGVMSCRLPLDLRLRAIVDPGRDMKTSLRRPAAVGLSAVAVLVLALMGSLAWTSIIETATVKSVVLPAGTEPLSIGTDGRLIFIEGLDGGPVPQRRNVSVLSPADLALIRRLDPKASGPAAAATSPWIPDLAGGALWFTSSGNVLVLSPEGNIQFEARLPEDRYRLLGYPILPAGENYVTFAVAREDIDAGILRFSGLILDRDLRPIKRFLEAIPFTGPPPPPPPPGGPGRDPAPLFKQVLRPKEEFVLLPDCIDFAVDGDRIFVADSRRGFHISVFDSHGNPLYEIHKDDEERPVPPGYYDSAVATLAARAGRETSILEPRRFYPAFRSLKIADGTIYLITYAQRRGLQEVVRMDLSGTIIGRSFAFPLPSEPKKFYRSSMLVNRQYCIQGGRIFCLVRNHAAGAFEVRIVDIL